MNANAAKHKIAFRARKVIGTFEKRAPGEQKSHRDKRKKENYNLKLCMSFICLVPDCDFCSPAAKSL